MFLVNYNFFEDFVFITIGITYLIAIISPGPSIIAILRNTLLGNNLGIFTAIGTITGIALQALFVLSGIKFMHFESIILEVIQIICAVYLIYIGIMALLKDIVCNYKKFTIQNRIMTKKEAFKQGFFIDALNPLALTFFLVIFSTFISKNTPLSYYILCWFEIVIIGIIWFIGISILLNINCIRDILVTRFYRVINLISLFLFVFLGVNLLFKLNIDKYL